MIALVVAPNSKKELRYIKLKAECADVLELRVDYLKNFDFKSKFFNSKELKNLGKPIIVTNRKKEEGGRFLGSEEKRIEILTKFRDGLNADYLDIEHSTVREKINELIKNKKNTKIIISYHNFNDTPNNLGDIYSDMGKLNPDLIKIVTTANSIPDNFRVFDMILGAGNEGRKIIAFCMGEYGQFSRILSVILGSQITYASCENGKESARGQFTIDEMCNIYRMQKINSGTKIAGLIGNPVEHSWSHIMHNASFDKLDINAVYLKFKVDKLKEFADYFKKLNVLGFSVTIPYKTQAMKCLDDINSKAEEIGAVNTIVVKNKKWIGYNTDCDGAMAALKEKTKLKGKNAVVLGAGGSARAVAYGLKENGAKIVILNRNTERASKIAKDFKCNYGSLDELEDFYYDILINTTSVGMHPKANECPIPPSLIRKNKIIFDIVFNPYKTRLLECAEKKGCTIIPGFEMLLNGAALQFSLWTGKDAPVDFMRKKVIEHLGQKFLQQSC